MIESVNSCLTCENLVDSLKCSKHDLSVEINNVCGDHSIKKGFFQSFQIVQAVLATKSLIVQTLVTQLLECFASLGLLINSTI